MQFLARLSAIDSFDSRVRIVDCLTPVSGAEIEYYAGGGGEVGDYVFEGTFGLVGAAEDLPGLGEGLAADLGKGEEVGGVEK